MEWALGFSGSEIITGLRRQGSKYTLDAHMQAMVYGEESASARYRARELNRAVQCSGLETGDIPGVVAYTKTHEFLRPADLRVEDAIRLLMIHRANGRVERSQVNNWSAYIKPASN